MCYVSERDRETARERAAQQTHEIQLKLNSVPKPFSFYYFCPFVEDECRRRRRCSTLFSLMDY